MDTQLLTSREIDVLQLLAGGFTYRQVADRLQRSPPPSDARQNIYQKLGVHSARAATGARWN